MSDVQARKPLPELLAELAPDGAGGFGLHVTPDWMQGRTLYGGISAALCLAAARHEHQGLPPLRSGMFSFVGPASGDVRLTTAIVRQGKSASFINVDLTSDAGPGTHASLCFGSSRQSAIGVDHLPMPDVPGPDATPPFFPGGVGPNFTQHFEVKLAYGSRPGSSAETADMMVWVRPLDEDVQPLEALWLALADMPPPAAFSLGAGFFPISTMTWMVTVLSPGHMSPDGWFLIRTTARHVADGYSEQTMLVWSSDGVPLMSAHQSVALFG